MLNSSSDTSNEAEVINLAKDIKLAVSQLGGTLSPSPNHAAAIESLEKLLVLLEDADKNS